MAQWLRIRLPMQATCVRALVREDPICHGATKPMRHNYLSLRAATTAARTPRARALRREATAVRSLRTTAKSSPHSTQPEKTCAQQRRPNAAKNK